METKFSKTEIKQKQNIDTIYKQLDNDCILLASNLQLNNETIPSAKFICKTDKNNFCVVDCGSYFEKATKSNLKWLLNDMIVYDNYMLIKIKTYTEICENALEKTM